ncbi:GTPase activating protein Gyp51 [Schizosaccharomyces japonicus yFS275]|uniref:GTPase activating protein Gyp51 n=1 Tax=Schizosaccharomyces japonicus (strain yFS275 / FY16936) TaxID=402676 RepID=B6JZH2_SCHJY|nr:GTPase activating protein Gyp51 [Schizosaccharomyces japonicus yFS275]EEB06940.1 GTPase activating protein Gyp51 [Schizosaccharomyces japonicus yFS275]
MTLENDQILLGSGPQEQFNEASIMQMALTGNYSDTSFTDDDDFGDALAEQRDDPDRTSVTSKHAPKANPHSLPQTPPKARESPEPLKLSQHKEQFHEPPKHNQDEQHSQQMTGNRSTPVSSTANDDSFGLYELERLKELVDESSSSLLGLSEDDSLTQSPVDSISTNHSAPVIPPKNKSRRRKPRGQRASTGSEPIHESASMTERSSETGSIDAKFTQTSDVEVTRKDSWKSVAESYSTAAAAAASVAAAKNKSAVSSTQPREHVASGSINSFTSVVSTRTELREAFSDHEHYRQQDVVPEVANVHRLIEDKTVSPIPETSSTVSAVVNSPPAVKPATEVLPAAASPESKETFDKNQDTLYANEQQSSPVRPRSVPSLVNQVPVHDLFSRPKSTLNIQNEIMEMERMFNELKGATPKNVRTSTPNALNNKPPLPPRTEFIPNIVVHPASEANSTAPSSSGANDVFVPEPVTAKSAVPALATQEEIQSPTSTHIAANAHFVSDQEIEFPIHRLRCAFLYEFIKKQDKMEISVQYALHDMLEKSKVQLANADLFELLKQLLDRPLEVLVKQSEVLDSVLTSHTSPHVHTALWRIIRGLLNSRKDLHYRALSTEKCPSDKQICKDLSRTFSEETLGRFVSNTMKRGSAKEEPPHAVLHRVLKAYAVHDPAVGYTQGMSWIAGTLLLYLQEEEAFQAFVLLFEEYGLRSLFSPGMNGLSRLMYQFSRLLEDTMPRLAIHFYREQLDPCAYASEWFLTLFAYRFPLDLAAHIYDHVFVYGPNVLLYFALALLKQEERHLLKLRVAPLVSFLKEDIFQKFHANSQYGLLLMKLVRSFPLTNEQVNYYGRQFDDQYNMECKLQEELSALTEEHERLKRQMQELSHRKKALQTEHRRMSSLFTREVLDMKRNLGIQAHLRSEIEQLKESFKKQQRDIEEEFRGGMEAAIAENLDIMGVNQQLEDSLFEKEKTLAEAKVNLATLDGDYTVALQKWRRLQNTVASDV